MPAFAVTFKTPSALTRLESDLASGKPGIRRPTVLPDLLPTTRKSSEALASALAAPVGGKVKELTPADGEGRRGFYLYVSERMVRTLAKDPRISTIEPEMWAKSDAARKD